GDFAQLHAGRKLLLQPGELALQRLTQQKNVATVLHGHRQADSRLAHEAHARRRRTIETAVHLGHVTDAEGPARYANWKITNLLVRLEAARHTQPNALAGRFDEACRHHRILRFQRLFHGLQRHSEGGQLDVGQLDPDLLVLQADQLDLANVLHPLQL